MATTLVLDTGDLDDLAREQAGSVARLTRALTPAQLAPTVADPLTDAVRSAWSGPYARVLASGTRVQTNPVLAVVTGGGGHLSGGANATDLVFGVEYGGGRRQGRVRASRRARAHTRATTRQFGGQTLTATRAIERATPAALDALADVVEEAVTGGR